MRILDQIRMDDEDPMLPPPDDGDGDKGGDQERERQTGLLLKPRPKTKKPSMYKVLLLNDDYTPMEFVVHILERFFSKNRQEATDIMLHVHRRGGWASAASSRTKSRKPRWRR